MLFKVENNIGYTRENINTPIYINEQDCGKIIDIVDGFILIDISDILYFQLVNNKIFNSIDTKIKDKFIFTRKPTPPQPTFKKYIQLKI